MLPLKLLKIELKRQGTLTSWYAYLNLKSKPLKTCKRIEFLQTCEENKVIPKFLKFRIPKNGCFNANEVERFQAKLLKIELKNAKHLLNKRRQDTEEFLSEFRPNIPAKLIPTVLLHTRIAWFTEKEKSPCKTPRQIKSSIH